MEPCSPSSTASSLLPVVAASSEAVAEVRQLTRYEATFKVLDDLYSLEDLNQIAALINSRRKYLANLSGWRLAVHASDAVVLLTGDKQGQHALEPETLPLWDAYYWTRQRPETIKASDNTNGLQVPDELGDPSRHEIVVLPTRTEDGAIAVMSFASGSAPFNALDRKFIRLLARQLSRHLSHLLMRRRVTRILQLHAYRDLLTGSLNRQAIVDHLKTQLSLSRRMNLPLSVMLVNVDWFKRVNDTYGHPGGDDVLRSLSERFQHSIRDSDAFGRYGSEEFLFVLYPCTLAQTDIISERVRRAAEARPFTIRAPGPASIPMTVSIGYSGTESQADVSAEELIAMADQALYESKARGRNGTGLSSTETMIAENEPCDSAH